MKKDRFSTDYYDYYLPEELIAQTPIKDRSHSRLLVLDRLRGNISHKRFDDIVDYLDSNDVLVLNNTKVLPSRIFGIKDVTGAKIETLLLKEVDNNIWECLVSPQKRLKVGTIINYSEDLKGEVISLLNDGITHIKFAYSGVFIEILERIGAMPLPPYIHEKLKDNDRYQTVYAKVLGSAAAPTAGLHFTNELLDKLKEKGVEILYVTLHVGLGTFRPVSESDIRNHDMHSEYYEIDEYTADKLNEAKGLGKRIISVGTTSLRTLESNYTKYKKFKATKEETNIFIYPGYHFKGVNSLITNFHLPKSTLIMLVCALAGRENIMNAYNEAVKEKYRFFSFGDAMFINNGNIKNTYKCYLKRFKYSNKPCMTYDYFKIVKGNNNIILSAPHAYKHIRNNRIKSNENNTSKIVKILSMLTNSHIIYTYKDCEDDPNYNKSSVYKKELLKYIEENNIKYLIDIHGLDKENNCPLEIGCNNYKNSSEEFVNLIKNTFSKYYDGNILIDEVFAAKSERRISNYISSKCNDINTVQLEINKKYRSINRMPIKFNKTIVALKEIIDNLEGK